ncbi:MAG TPA: ABC transporter substrate-binding protein [Burkholderiaceae bacterium]|jgi:ABC-type transport system substrate-binding protein|nr:ABC transporter substrate-binding protein [Burkholderiaceae bacterium]
MNLVSAGLRRAGIALAGACIAGLLVGAASAPGEPASGPVPRLLAPIPPPSGPKVLRYAFRVAETTFDPAAANDIYSRIITAHIFEALYDYDPLASPVSIRPCTATALPEIDDDFRRFTVHIKPGIYFQDDPAFGGRKRELVATDYLYALKRFADPANRSPSWTDISENHIKGLEEARQRALDARKPFDYDAPVQGLQALDRYTLRIELEQPRPRFIETLASGDLYGAVAREVVERYGEDVGAHPVGTGPFRLAAWRRASHIVLDRNPGYRDVRYEAQPAADDLEGQAIAKRLEGRRLPMIDRVEVSIIEQDQPRWLSFLNGEVNFIERVPEAFIDVAMPGGKLAPNLAKRGIRAYRVLSPDMNLTTFNMEDPVVGGNDAQHVALRRAIGLGIDVARESRLVRHGQTIPAQGMIAPLTSGYDPNFRSEMGDYDPARARALLDLYGYVDRDGDGWREQPDGSPLTLVIHNQSDAASHQLGELWKRNMDALGLRTEFVIAQWPENLKAARAGKFMIWDVNSLAAQHDGLPALERVYGPAAGGSNLARFHLEAFDDLYRRLLLAPDGPEREAMFLQAKRLEIAYMPYKVHSHRIVTDMSTRDVIGYRRPTFWLDWWEYIDIEAHPAK